MFRRHFICFYCGTKSARTQTGTIRAWQCDSCEAVNHLDEKGQITDPPTETIPRPVQYAHQPRRSLSPTISPQDHNLFCRACLQNQYVYTQTLASYLPPPSDPSYDKYEASAEEYKSNLAKRYPQVCADCAPKVNKRLRDATYAAKTDHLRRMMERTRGGNIRPMRKRWHWLHLVVLAGGAMWWASLLAEIVWHIIGVLPLAEKQLELHSDSMLAHMACILHALSTWETQSSCFHVATKMAKMSIGLGVLSLWWNNKIGWKLSSRNGKLRGVGKYIGFQSLILALRAAVVWTLQDADSLHTPDPTKGAHYATLVLLVLSTTYSLTMVTLSEKPLVSFTGLQPVIADPVTTPKPHSHSHTHFASQFPISALAPRAPSPDQGYETASVTTSIDTTDSMDDDMSMEWTPTRITKTITPRRSAQPPHPQPIFSQTSPFYGTLPPAPMAPAHKARRPLQPFIPASQARKDTLFQQMTGSSEQKKNLDFGGQKRQEYQLREPTLHDPSTGSKETGLEGLFNSAFSIGKEPSEVRDNERPSSSRGVPGLQRGHIYAGETVREGVLFGRLLVGLVIAGIAASGLAWLNGGFS